VIASPEFYKGVLLAFFKFSC